jgi:hypothetical protein
VDFAVAGFGLGSLALLAGLLLRDCGAFWRRSRPRRPVDIVADARTRAGGRTLAVVGGFVLVATALALFFAPGDTAGAIVTGVAVAVAAAGMTAWTWQTARLMAPVRERAGADRQPAPRPAAHAQESSPADEEIVFAMPRIDDRSGSSDPQSHGAFTSPDGFEPVPDSIREFAGADRAAVAPEPAVGAAAAAHDVLAADGDDRAAAFAPIPLFREPGAAEDRVVAGTVAAPGARRISGLGRPLPWEEPQHAEAEFFLDETSTVEPADRRPAGSPPIPFARPAPRR